MPWGYRYPQLTDDEVAVLGPQAIRQLFITEAQERFLPGEVFQLLSDDVYSKPVPAEAQLAKQVELMRQK